MRSEPVLSEDERVAWIRGDRAVRYRERADQLEQIARAESRPREQARVLELATQYRRLADDIADQQTRTPTALSRAPRTRNEQASRTIARV